MERLCLTFVCMMDMLCPTFLWRNDNQSCSLFLSSGRLVVQSTGTCLFSLQFCGCCHHHIDEEMTAQRCEEPCPREKSLTSYLASLCFTMNTQGTPWSEEGSSVSLPCHMWAAIRTGHWVACGHQGFPASCCPEPFNSSFL